MTEQKENELIVLSVAQLNFLDKMKQKKGNAKLSCKAAGITTKEYDEWMKNEDFKKAVGRARRNMANNYNYKGMV